jgi:hypothetical protein
MALTLGQFLDPLKVTAEGGMWIEDVEQRFGKAWEEARALELNNTVLARCVLLIIDAIRADVHRASHEERYNVAVQGGRELLAKIGKRAAEIGFTLPPELIRAPLSFAEDFEQAGLVEIVGNSVILPSQDR